MYHNPVLLKESIEGLAIKQDGIYVDVTYGGGGHSVGILKKLKTGKLFAFEQDEEALKNKIEDTKLTLLNHNFRFIKNFLNYYGINEVDGIIADLGVSSYQIDTAERGFSTRFEGELDMRMNKNRKLTAKKLVNEYSEEQLTEVFRNYGEIENAKILSRNIAKKRITTEIRTTEQLKEVVKASAPGMNEIKYFSKVFQAIRIEVNEELESLKDMLLQTTSLIKKEGRLVVISYHSLEDRLVKNFIKSGNFEGEISKDFFGNQIVPFKQINRKVLIAGDVEVNANSRARSAKLRIAERVVSLKS